MFSASALRSRGTGDWTSSFQPDTMMDSSNDGGSLKLVQREQKRRASVGSVAPPPPPQTRANLHAARNARENGHDNIDDGDDDIPLFVSSTALTTTSSQQQQQPSQRRREFDYLTRGDTNGMPSKYVLDTDYRVPLSEPFVRTRAPLQQQQPSLQDVSSWPRAVLEARVNTLEKMLARDHDSSNTRSLTDFPDSELSQHLQVTVRKNRELRAELEVMRGQVDRLLAEREQTATRLSEEHGKVQSIVTETVRAREALADIIRTLTQDKAALTLKVAELEQRLREVARPMVNNSSNYQQQPGITSSPLMKDLDLKGSLDDVALINEALHESLKQLRLRQSTGS